jgi:hypothetical protein
MVSQFGGRGDVLNKTVLITIKYYESLEEEKNQ